MIKENPIIIIEKIHAEGEIMINKIQNNSHDDMHPIFEHPSNKKYYLD